MKNYLKEGYEYANVGLTEHLMEFGLIRQEATIYLNLMDGGCRQAMKYPSRQAFRVLTYGHRVSGPVEKGVSF